ncbi:MAG: HEAT repeat domain-containing protein [Geminicoccaceae bacterium]
MRSGRRAGARAQRVGGMIAIVLALAPLHVPEAAEIGWDGVHLSIRDADGPVVSLLEDIALTLGAGLVIRGELGDVRQTSLAAGEPGAIIRELVRPHSLIVRYDGETGLPRQIVVRESPGGSTDYGTAAAVASHPVPQLVNHPAVDDEAFKTRLRDLAVEGGPAAAREIARMSSGPARPEMRRLAIVALTRIGGNEALSALRDGLRDSHPRIRLQAARGLVRLLDGGATGDLAAALRTEPDQTVAEAMQRLIERND